MTGNGRPFTAFCKLESNKESASEHPCLPIRSGTDDRSLKSPVLLCSSHIYIYKYLTYSYDDSQALAAGSSMDHQHQPSTPAVGHNSALFAQNQINGTLPNGTFGTLTGTPLSAASSNMTFHMPVSPVKGQRSSNDGYRPKIARTCGQRPACLVNASVTYCGNNQIYAFGGFDQYTDEGKFLR